MSERRRLSDGNRIQTRLCVLSCYWLEVGRQTSSQPVSLFLLALWLVSACEYVSRDFIKKRSRRLRHHYVGYWRCRIPVPVPLSFDWLRLSTFGARRVVAILVLVLVLAVVLVLVGGGGEGEGGLEIACAFVLLACQTVIGQLLSFCCRTRYWTVIRSRRQLLTAGPQLTFEAKRSSD